jgi:hypothetical protein
MDEDDSISSVIAATTITARPEVRSGTRSFEVDIATVADGRI